MSDGWEVCSYASHQQLSSNYRTFRYRHLKNKSCFALYYGRALLTRFRPKDRRIFSCLYGHRAAREHWNSQGVRMWRTFSHSQLLWTQKSIKGFKGFKGLRGLSYLNAGAGFECLSHQICHMWINIGHGTMTELYGRHSMDFNCLLFRNLYKGSRGLSGSKLPQCVSLSLSVLDTKYVIFELM